jgi:hypothetical protein
VQVTRPLIEQRSMVCAKPDSTEREKTPIDSYFIDSDSIARAGQRSQLDCAEPHGGRDRLYLEARLSSRRTRLSRQPPTLQPLAVRKPFTPFCARSFVRIGWLTANAPSEGRSMSRLRYRRQGHLPLEGLISSRQATENDAHRRRIPAPLHAACPAARIGPDSLVRLPPESAPETASASLSPVVARRSGATFGDGRKIA